VQLAAPALGTEDGTVTLPSTATRPVSLTAEEAAVITAEIHRRRAEAERWLQTDPTSYLATTERHDFERRVVLTVGSGSAADVRIDDPALHPQHLTVTALEDGFRIEAAAPAATFKIGDTVVRQGVLSSGFVELGRYRLRLSHQGFPAIVVLDREKVRLAGVVRPRYFPVDLSYRYVVPLTAAARAEPVVILSTRGHQRRALRAGWFDLEIAGTSCRVEAVRLLEPGVGESSYGLYFRDLTTEHETYPVGRYLDPEELPDGTYLIDFNLAYNPACAFSPHYNCPIPTRENTLPIQIRAGEMTPEGAH